MHLKGMCWKTNCQQTIAVLRARFLREIKEVDIRIFWNMDVIKTQFNRFSLFARGCHNVFCQYLWVIFFCLFANVRKELVLEIAKIVHFGLHFRPLEILIKSSTYYIDEITAAETPCITPTLTDGLPPTFCSNFRKRLWNRFRHRLTTIFRVFSVCLLGVTFNFF